MDSRSLCACAHVSDPSSLTEAVQVAMEDRDRGSRRERTVVGSECEDCRFGIRCRAGAMPRGGAPLADKARAANARYAGGPQVVIGCASIFFSEHAAHRRRGGKKLFFVNFNV